MLQVGCLLAVIVLLAAIYERIIHPPKDWVAYADEQLKIRRMATAGKLADQPQRVAKAFGGFIPPPLRQAQHGLDQVCEFTPGPKESFLAPKCRVSVPLLALQSQCSWFCNSSAEVGWCSTGTRRKIDSIARWTAGRWARTVALSRKVSQAASASPSVARTRSQ
eukprot:COSAG06_NODE_2834_length_6204_cov_12.577396_5_plen_164_part_00